MTRSRLAASAVALVAAAGLTATTATGAVAAPGAKAKARAGSVARVLPPNKQYSTAKLGLSGASARSLAPRAAAADPTPAVGTVRQWIALDDFNGILYRKDYTLRGVGEKIEVWVANDTAFPAGDCRTQIPDSTTVTDAQVARLIEQFDTNMFPKETAVFSTPPDRDGTNSVIPPDANGNGGVYTGDGDKTVALIDNVRDDNFFDFPAHPTYIAGFFSSQFNDLVDRNVMTIDAFDWAHRSGDDPPDEPTADLCTSRPARPNLYEGTFAHEWQHLLHHYTDPFETTWMNEGLSDWAQTLTGYVDTTATVFDRGADSHLYCFQGFGPVQTPFNPNPRDCGGSENSLNLWGEDQGNPNGVLADYGHAYSLMQYLSDHFGQEIISLLHNDGELQGLASLKAALQDEGADLYRTLHDHQSMVLLDKLIDDADKATIKGTTRDRVTTPSLRSSVNLDNPDSFDDPGAAPNGADYVRLRGANGRTLKGSQLKSLQFDGAQTLPPKPLEWTVVDNDPDRPGNPVIWSGNESNLDASAVFHADVPTANPTLTFLAKYGAEAGFDYGYVMVSTDGGATYTPIAGDKTVDAPLGPGLNGTTDGFEPHSYDLSAYAGQPVLIALRYVSDGGVNEGGLLVDDIMVGDTLISDGSSLDPFDSITEVRPLEVASWHVALVGIKNGKHLRISQFTYDGRNRIRLSRPRNGLFNGFDEVVAIVGFDDPTEQIQQYAPYTLTVNGVVQPGGTAAD